MQVKEQVRTGHGKTDWFKIGKVREGCILLSCLFNLYAEYIPQMRCGWITSWNQDCQQKYHQPDICRWYQSNGRKQRETKQPASWWGWKRRMKSWLKTQHSNIKIMASNPIPSWQIHGETVETVTNFIFLGSKITADGDCSHEIKRCLLLGIKAFTKLVSLLKNKDITLPKRSI